MILRKCIRRFQRLRQSGSQKDQKHREQTVRRGPDEEESADGEVAHAQVGPSR